MLLQNLFSWEAAHGLNDSESMAIYWTPTFQLGFHSRFYVIYYCFIFFHRFGAEGDLVLHVCPWAVCLWRSEIKLQEYFSPSLCVLRRSRLSGLVAGFLAGSVCFCICMMCVCFHVCDHSVCIPWWTGGGRRRPHPSLPSTLCEAGCLWDSPLCAPGRVPVCFSEFCLCLPHRGNTRTADLC